MVIIGFRRLILDQSSVLLFKSSKREISAPETVRGASDILGGGGGGAHACTGTQ